MTTTPTQHGAAIAAAIAAFIAGGSQSALANALAAALTDYDDVGGLAERIEALITENATIISALNLFDPKGAVALVSNLPTSAAEGEFWVISSGEFARHGYIRSGGAWVDMGVIQGPIGLTPAVSVTITTLNPGATPTVTKTGGDEAPSFELGLPRARNARHSLSVSAAYALEAGEMLALWCAEQDTTFDVAASRAKAKVAATAATTIAIRKNGSAWGTITWAADATAATVTIASPTVAAGDLIEFVAPTPADATLAHVAITLAGAA